MISLDTNLILRLILKDVPEQLDSIRLLIDTAKPNNLHVADVVFFEAAWILGGSAYRLDRPLIGELVLQIARMPQINCNRAMLEKVIPLYIEHTKISLVDASLAVYAELNHSLPLLTLDKKLAKALPSHTELMGVSG